MSRPAVEVAAPVSGAGRINVVTFHEPGVGGWFAAEVTLPADTRHVLPRDVTVVIDTSERMPESSLALASRAVMHVASELRPGDRVSVMTTSPEVRAFASAPVPVGRRRTEALRSFVEGLRPGGAAGSEDALLRAAAPVQPGRISAVLFLTGRAEIGAGAARLRALAFVADASGGAEGPREVPADPPAGLVARAFPPAVAHLRLAVRGGAVEDVRPAIAVVPACTGSVMFTGRWREAGEAEFTVHGTRADAPFALSGRVTFAADVEGTSLVRDLHDLSLASFPTASETALAAATWVDRTAPRRSGSRRLRCGGCGSKRAPTTTHVAADWFGTRQWSDGRWADDGPAPLGDAGTTGLVLLTYLGRGETHESGMFRDQVKAALDFLRTVQGTEGWFTPYWGDAGLVDHAWATLAMCEAYDFTRSPSLQDSATRAVSVVQDPASGFRTSAQPRVLVLAALVLASARRAQLEVDPRAFADVIERAETVSPDASAGDRVAATLARILCAGTTPEEGVSACGVDGVPCDLPRLDDEAADPETWYFATVLAFAVGRATWREWSEALRPVIDAVAQREGDPHLGSWAPVGPASSRLHTTAHAILMAQIYYRYGRVLGVR